MRTAEPAHERILSGMRHRVPVRPSRRSLALRSAILLAGVALAACGRPSAPEGRATGGVIYLQPTSAAAPSTAAWPRVRIGNDSRPILGSYRPLPVVTRQPVELGGAAFATLPVSVPPAVTQAGDTLLLGRISIRVPRNSGSMAALREGGRMALRSAPAVASQSGQGDTATLRFPVPPAARFKSGELTVLGYPFPPASRERFDTDPITVPASARLEFGYGIDTPGWRVGAAPVVFRALAVRDGQAAVVFERRLDPATDERDRRWHDASVDLGGLAGARVRFVFETEALPLAGAADRPFAVVSSPVVVTGAATPRRRNVVLISLDTLRARSVGAYGAAHQTSPSLDRRVAAPGALVRAAVTAAPFTPPAHMTMLTGLEPCVHGVYDHRTVLAPERTTLAEALRAAGYRTAAFTEDAYVVAETGFARGFDTYVENRSEESSAPGFAAQTFGDAIGWLARHGDQPFFLFIHTYQVHDPYTPPRAYQRFFAPAAPPPPGTLQADLLRYEEEIRYTDDVLADFLDALDAFGLADDTIVIVTSDHGEAFGEHAVTGHGPDLHDEALLVPLIVRAPGLVPAGTVVEEQVGLVDLVPTVLDLVGVSVPPTQGGSFAGLLTGRGDSAWPGVTLSVAVGGSTADPTRAVRTTRYKYIRDANGSELLYDLAADPLEQRNLVETGAPPAVLTDMRAALAKTWAECGTWQAAHPASGPAPATMVDQPGWLVNRDELARSFEHLSAEKAADPESFRKAMEAFSKMTPAEREAFQKFSRALRGAPAPPPAPAPPAPPSEEVEDKLRSLGYLDDSAGSR